MKALKKWIFLALCMIGATDVFAAKSKRNNKASLPVASGLAIPKQKMQPKMEQGDEESSCCLFLKSGECAEAICFIVAPYLCAPGLDCCCCKGNYYQGALLCTAAACALTTSEWLRKRRLSQFKQDVSMKRE